MRRGPRGVKIVLPFLTNTLMNFVIGLLLARFLGPAEYGRMALALATGQVMQTLMFDWLRLAATRFYSERTRREQPQLRASFDLSFAGAIVVICSSAVAFMLTGIDVPLSHGLIGLAVGAAVANGLFDYHTALVRARFLDGAYARIIMGKNVLSLLLTVGGAWIFGSAVMALTGLCLSMTGSLVAARRSLTDPEAAPQIAQKALVAQAFRYAMPIVTASMLYQLIPLIDRALIAQKYGFAESGQFSLAYDLGIRIALAVGSTLDVLLFQIAVRAEESHGVHHARQQIARNIGVVLAIIVPTMTGVWLVMPSFEHLVVPPEFRGPFGHFLGLMLPGFACYGLIYYAVHPIFQIRTRTRPLIAAGALATVCNLALIHALPAQNGATNFAYALTGSLGLALLLLVLMATLTQATWPRPRDVVVTGFGTLAMVAAVLPLRSLTPGVVTLALQACVGAAVYGVFVFGFDVAGLRRVALDHLPRTGRIARRQEV